MYHVNVNSARKALVDDTIRVLLSYQIMPYIIVNCKLILKSPLGRIDIDIKVYQSILNYASVQIKEKLASLFSANHIRENNGSANQSKTSVRVSTMA